MWGFILPLVEVVDFSLHQFTHCYLKFNENLIFVIFLSGQRPSNYSKKEIRKIPRKVSWEKNNVFPTQTDVFVVSYSSC